MVNCIVQIESLVEDATYQIIYQVRNAHCQRSHLLQSLSPMCTIHLLYTISVSIASPIGVDTDKSYSNKVGGVLNLMEKYGEIKE